MRPPGRIPRHPGAGMGMMERRGNGEMPARRTPRREVPVEPQRRPAARMSPTDARLRRSSWWWARAVCMLGAALLTWELLLVLRGLVVAMLAIVLLTVIAGVVAVLCAPITNLLSGRGHLPRTVAVLVSLGALVAAVAGVIVIVSGPLISEGRSLIHFLPALQTRLDAAQAWLDQRGVRVGSLSLEKLLGQLIGGSPASAGGFVISAVTGTFSVIVDVVVVLVASFWFLRDSDRLRHLIVDNLPSSWRSHVNFAFSAFAVVIGGYVRGQVTLAILVGTLSGVGCAILGVPFPLVIAVAAGFFELIPMVGPFIGGAVAVLLATTVGPSLVVEVIALFVCIHIIEGYLVVPRLQARFVRLHPVVAFLALFAGIETGGFLGALVAVPMASLGAVLLRVVIGDVRAERPQLFESRPNAAARAVEGRRRRLLREYRLFNGNPVEAVLRRVGLRH